MTPQPVSLTERLGRWLAAQSDVRVAVVQAVGVGVLAWVGAVLSIALTARDGIGFVLVSVVTLLTVSAFALAARWVTMVRDKYVGERKEAIAFVHEQLERVAIESQADILNDRAKTLVPAAPAEDIRRITRAVYEFVSRYRSTGLPGEEVVLEAVFMTQSYADGLITIAAWANTDDRKPRSLTMREDNPEIYDATVTADVYREAEQRRPEPRIIEDTASDSDYQQLYDRQYQRIRSTVVHPVLSGAGDLLGTLVATADHAGFFRHADARYWESLFTIYARRLALQKVRLDRSVVAGSVKPF